MSASPHLRFPSPHGTHRWCPTCQLQSLRIGWRGDGNSLCQHRHPGRLATLLPVGGRWGQLLRHTSLPTHTSLYKGGDRSPDTPTTHTHICMKVGTAPQTPLPTSHVCRRKVGTAAYLSMVTPRGAAHCSALSFVPSWPLSSMVFTKLSMKSTRPRPEPWGGSPAHQGGVRHLVKNSGARGHWLPGGRHLCGPLLTALTAQ